MVPLTALQLLSRLKTNVINKLLTSPPKVICNATGIEEWLAYHAGTSQV